MNWLEVHAAIDHAREQQQTWEHEAYLSRLAKSARQHQAEDDTVHQVRQGIDRTMQILGGMLKTPITRAR
jgi:hypothetical protein